MGEHAQTNDTVRTAYDAVAADYSRAMPDTSREHPLDLAILDTFIAMVGRQRILDGGCGAGRISRYIADRGGRVHGVDLSPQMISQARAQHPDLGFDVASITDLPYDDASFGGVLLWYSTIHLSEVDLGRALDESIRLLARGGYLLVSFQSGVGSRKLFEAHQRGGQHGAIDRYLRSTDEMSTQLSERGTTEMVRLVRKGFGVDQDDHTMLLHHKVGEAA